MSSDDVRQLVNNRLQNQSVVTAALLDSKCCDGLQMADLIAGCVAFDTRRRAGHVDTNGPKSVVVDQLKLAFNLPAFNGRTPRTNVAVYRPATGAES